MQDAATLSSSYYQSTPANLTLLPEQEHLQCPRCNSTNAKFCYYNNYNLSQPRHFCRTCRRHWTKGGALRNVPVGGRSRRPTKRSSKHPSYQLTTDRTADPVEFELPGSVRIPSGFLVSDQVLGSNNGGSDEGCYWSEGSNLWSDLAI